MARLIDYLKSLKLSNKEAKDLLETGKVMYHGIPTADGCRDVNTSFVALQRNAPRLRPNRDLAVIYRDEHFAIAYKPSGMLSTFTAGRRDVKNVISVVKGFFGSAYPVHRLDEGTSGLMMVALTEKCQQLIKEMLFHHNVERGYLALVSGWFQNRPCTSRTLLVRNRGDGLRGSSEDLEDGAKEAVTHLSLVEHVGKNVSLVQAKLETGRTHQVRIHLSEKNYPILGDKLYAPSNVARASRRLALHAFKLGLKHPITGKKLSFESPLADDLEMLRRRLLR